MMQKYCLWTSYEHDNPAPWAKDIKLLVADVLRQFSLPFLHAFWPLKSHKFGDDIQGTVSNTNMSNLLKMNKEDTCLRSHCCLYQYQDNDVSTHYTTNISMKTRRTLKLKLIVVFHHQCTLAYYRDQGPCKWNHRSILFWGGSYFKIDQIMSGALRTTRKLDNKSKKNSPDIMILPHKKLVWQAFFKIMLPQTWNLLQTSFHP